MSGAITIYSPTTCANGGPFPDWNGQSGPAANSIMVVNNSIYTFWFEAASTIGLIIPPGNQCVFPLAPSSSYRIYADPTQPAVIAVAMNVTLTEQTQGVTGVIYTPLAPMNTQPGSSELNPLYVTTTDPTTTAATLSGTQVLTNTGGTHLFDTPDMFGNLQTLAGIVISTDTNGLVIFGSYVVPGPGLLPSVVWYEGYLKVGKPYTISFGDKGLFVGPTFLHWSAEHQINGATLAWTVYGAN